MFLIGLNFTQLARIMDNFIVMALVGLPTTQFIPIKSSICENQNFVFRSDLIFVGIPIFKALW